MKKGLHYRLVFARVDPVGEGGPWDSEAEAQRVLDDAQVQIVSLDGTVLAAAEITGITKHGDRGSVRSAPAAPTLRCSA
jgi:hypothetical protein